MAVTSIGVSSRFRRPVRPVHRQEAGRSGKDSPPAEAFSSNRVGRSPVCLSRWLPGRHAPRQALLAGLFALLILYTIGELVHSPGAGALSVNAAPLATRGRCLAAY